MRTPTKGKMFFDLMVLRQLLIVMPKWGSSKTNRPVLWRRGGEGLERVGKLHCYFFEGEVFFEIEQCPEYQIIYGLNVDAHRRGDFLVAHVQIKF